MLPANRYPKELIPGLVIHCIEGREGKGKGKGRGNREGQGLTEGVVVCEGLFGDYMDSLPC
jgi:hypothetical protein